MKITAEIETELLVLNLIENQKIASLTYKNKLGFLFPKNKFSQYEEIKKIKAEIPEVIISNNMPVNIFNDHPLLYRDFAKLNLFTSDLEIFIHKYGRLGVSKPLDLKDINNRDIEINYMAGKDGIASLGIKPRLTKLDQLDQSLYSYESFDEWRNNRDIMNICINFNNSIKLESNHKKNNEVYEYSYPSNNTTYHVKIEHLDIVHPSDEHKTEEEKKLDLHTLGKFAHVNETFSINTKMDKDYQIISRSLIAINNSIYEDSGNNNEEELDENYFFYDDENIIMTQENGIDLFGEEELIHTVSYENKNVSYEDYKNNRRQFNKELLLSYLEQKLNSFDLKFNINGTYKEKNNFSANFSTTSLLHILWLQFAHEVFNEPEILRCKNFKNCNNNIIINSKKDLEKSFIDFNKLSRKKKDYCSDACRQSFYQDNISAKLEYREFLELLNKHIQKNTKSLPSLGKMEVRGLNLLSSDFTAKYDYTLTIDLNNIKSTYFIEIKHRPSTIQSRHIKGLLNILDMKKHDEKKLMQNFKIILICSGISNQALKKIKINNLKEDIATVISIEDNIFRKHFGEDNIINEALYSIGLGENKFKYVDIYQN